MSLSVLITGATGFVGGALCDLLTQQGHALKGALRMPTKLFPYPSIAVGHIGPATDWRDALAGCDAVVHLAAHVHVMRSTSESSGVYRAVNVEGTRNLARQAARSGVRRFVFMSSVKVHGEATVGRALVEGDPPMPVDDYGRSKIEAEKRLTTIAAETGMEVAIVRPPLVYGPGVKANFRSLLRAVDAGIPLPFSSVHNKRSLIYLGNLAHAIAMCLTHRAAANRPFFVSDGQDVSTPQLIDEVAAALGKKARLFPFPPAGLRAAGALVGRAEMISRLTSSLQVDISSIRSTLGWEPPFTLSQGLAETASWYQDRR
jgi:nucleoside-diphosphate-sugar epimerase